jgi:hypothetical protein
MDLWDQGSFQALVDDTEQEALSKVSKPRAQDDESIARAFNARVLSGRLRSAVRNLTSREAGGVLSADGICSKTGRPVVDVLREKHPDIRDPPSVGGATGAFERYPLLPTAIPVCVTGDTVEQVAAKLSGAAGPGGTDAVDLRSLLLRFGTESAAFREEMAAWASWIANDSPPWAAYRALMAARLIALDKSPSVRPVGIGEIYRSLWAKTILAVVGSQATAACDNLNLCAGLAAGIEGAVHAVREVYEAGRHLEAVEPPVATPTRTPPDPPESDNAAMLLTQEPAPADPPDSDDDSCADAMLFTQ